MRVDGVGELSDRGYWCLVYDGCGHVQQFAHEGLDDLSQAAVYVKRHFAECLMCASNKRTITLDQLNVRPSERHLVVSADELLRLINALRQAGDEDLVARFDQILRQTAQPEPSQNPT